MATALSSTLNYCRDKWGSARQVMSSITTIISHLVLLADVKDNKPTGYSVNENVPVFDLLNSSLWVCIAIIYLDEIIWGLSLIGHVYNAKKNAGNGYKSP